MFGLLGVSKAERAARYQRVIEEFALTELQQAKGGTLSGGERRRVELARTLASAPSIILRMSPSQPSIRSHPGSLRCLVALPNQALAYSLPTMMCNNRFRFVTESHPPPARSSPQANQRA